jgi:hypothetical protein
MDFEDDTPSAEEAFYGFFRTFGAKIKLLVGHPRAALAL